MGFESVDTRKTFISLKDKEVGEILVTGYYQGDEPNKFGGVNVLFKDKEGKTLAVGNSILADMLEENFDFGDYVQIKFAGKAKSKATGNLYNTFDIAIDREESEKSKYKKSGFKPVVTNVEPKSNDNNLNEITTY